MHRALRRLARPAALTAVGALAAADHARPDCIQRGVSPAVHAELSKLRPGEAEMRQRWEDDERGWRRLPPRAWPAYQPTPDERDELQRRLQTSGCRPDDPVLSQECKKASFDLATCLIFNALDVPAGLDLYQSLADRNDLDAMVGIGVVLVEGIGNYRVDEAAGLQWLRRAAAGDNVQGMYEVGVLHYMGLDDLVPMDEAAAFKWFERAAAQQHTSALFMLADCLIDGCGCDKDFPRAVPLLHAAAERGHRFARQYILEWLDEDAAAWPTVNVG